MDLSPNEPNESVVDGSVIQRLVAERHGMQRARLGWTEQELIREFSILGEELADAVRRRAPRAHVSPSPEGSAGEAERAIEFLTNAMKVAEGVSLETFRQAIEENGSASATV